MSTSLSCVGVASRGHVARLAVQDLQMVCPHARVRGSLSRQLNACLQLEQERQFLRAEIPGLLGGSLWGRDTREILDWGVV